MMRTLVFMLALCATAAQAVDGDIDPSFGTAGYIVQAPTDASLAPYGMTIQEDGRIVVTGARWAFNEAPEVQNQVAVWRFLADGNPDPAFGTDGLTGIALGADIHPLPLAVLVQASGGMLVAGNLGGFGILRLQADGTIDTGFGQDGLALVQCPGASLVSSAAHALALDSQGRILAAGGGAITGTRTLGLIARLLADGALDVTFGNGGCVQLVPASGNDSASSWLRGVVVDEAGRVLVAGHGNADGTRGFFAVRLEPSGRLDASFGDAGKVFVASALTTNLIASNSVLIHGRWLLGGVCDALSSSASACLLALDANGMPDPAFGTQGWALAPLGGFGHTFSSLACQSDGKCLQLASARPDSQSHRQYVVTRFGTGGIPDPGFGVSGQVHIDVPSGGDGNSIVARAITLQGGKPIAAGMTGGAATHGGLFATRLQADLIFADAFD